MNSLMAVTCKKCGGAHPQWECTASAAKIESFERSKALPEDTAPALPPKRGKARPKTITDMKAYKAEKERKRRADGKVKPKGKKS